MTRTCGEEAGGGLGGQMKKILVFHGLGPEKNETGERLMMMAMMIMMMMSKFMMLMMMAMILQVRNLWRGSKTCWN